MSIDLSGSYQDLSASTLSFQNRREFEASRSLFETRSENQKPFVKKKEVNTIWDLDPIDFSVKLYHPKPVKRNSREAIRPWTYDKYLKKIDPDDIKLVQKVSADKALVESYLSDAANSSVQSEIDFEKSFRVLTPNGARMEASKTMGFREGLDQFKNPMPHDFRGLKKMYGMPEFKSRFERDPYNIKFLTNSLNQIHGLARSTSLRDVHPGLQMGDKVKKQDPDYDPKLVLPRLPFPNKFYGYTRYRSKDRSVESAFWDRALPKLNERLNDKQFSSSKENIDSDQ